MPFIPHSEDEIKSMLDTIGVSSIEDLFDEIPESLRCGRLEKVPEGLSEMEVGQIMAARAKQDGDAACFIGAGAYDHHIPAAVWEITTRGEFYSAYTPYQAEASQGTLQLLYEYQTMMASLTGMDISNASMYDGASGLAEAMLMAVRANRKSKSRKILVPEALHPAYRKVCHTIIKNQKIEMVELPYDRATGKTDLAALKAHDGEDFAAVVIAQPNFFGALEDANEMTDWAHANKALAIACVNPVSLAILEAPGNWGEQGADICVGEGQPMGAPLSSGGPYFGFLTCKMPLARQVPGRIIGRTVDLDGKEGFALTLQAREQHIRRSKATSNICTNQGLLVTAATIHMTLLGFDGLVRVADACHANTNKLVDMLSSIDGVERVFSSTVFHEQVIRLPKNASDVLRALANDNILGGYDLGKDYPELENCILVCATETRTEDQIAAYKDSLAKAVA